MEIRILREEDIPAIVDLVFAHRKTKTPMLPIKIKEDISKILWTNLGAPFTQTFVAFEYGAVFGFINLHLIEFPMIIGKECYVSDLLVNENNRGKGIGSKLMDEAEKYARDNNCTRMMLNNGKYTVSYQRGFYRGRGYNERRNVSNFVKDIQLE